MKRIVLVFVSFFLMNGLQAQSADTADVYSDVDEKILSYVDEMPEPPYDVSAKIAELLKYPDEAIKKKLEGKVFVKFVVDEEGNIKKVRAKRRANKILAKAAVEAVSQLPKWIPGEQDGVPVKVYFTLPVSFKLK